MKYEVKILTMKKQSWITGVCQCNQPSKHAEIIPSPFSPAYRRADCFSAIRQTALQTINLKSDYCLLNY